MAYILNFLRSAPPPRLSPENPLSVDVPAAQLPLDPVLYITSVVDSVAPLLKLRPVRGRAGGGVTILVPSPLPVRQRRRVAFNWILGAAEKRKNNGSGRYTFPQRVAEEIIAIAEGRSAAWEKRDQLYKQAVNVRSNISSKKMSFRR